MMCGENGLDRGSDLGPWTVQLSFKPDTPFFPGIATSR